MVDYAKQDEEHQALVAFEPCGCKMAVVVLTGYEASAYKEAARWAKEGARVEQMSVAEFKRRPLRCPDHPKGPPWWESNGGKGKRPPQPEAPTQEMGL